MKELQVLAVVMILGFTYGCTGNKISGNVSNSEVKSGDVKVDTKLDAKIDTTKKP